MCMTHSKTQIPFEILNHQTKQSERLTQSAVCSRSQGAREGPDSGIFFCTICAQVTLVCCKPLQVVALKQRCTACTASPSVRGEAVHAAGFCCFLCNASCLQLATLLQNLDTTFHSCAVLPQTLGLPGYPSLYRSSPAQLTSVACAFTSISL